MTDWTPPPPGDRREQLPDDVLALLVPGTYKSTACQTALDLAVAILAHPGRDDLVGWRDRMHARCRLQHKYLGLPCRCRCHRA